jgi:hypothetical protein
MALVRFVPPLQYPSDGPRIKKGGLRPLSVAIVAALRRTRCVKLVVDNENAESMAMFQLAPNQYDKLPHNPHPDDIVDEPTRKLVFADVNWYVMYEKKHNTDLENVTAIKEWVLAVVPIDLYNKIIKEAGGAGHESHPEFTMRRIIPLILATLSTQGINELKIIKLEVAKPLDPSKQTLEGWLLDMMLNIDLAKRLGYTYNTVDTIDNIWDGMVHLHSAAVNTFKMTWITTHTDPTTRTPETLSAEIVAWEQTMVDSKQVVFENTRMSAGFKAVSFGSTSSTDAVLNGTMKAAKQAGMSDDSIAILARFVEAGLDTIEYKKSHPDFKLPPKTCVKHGMCYHPTDECGRKQGP